MKPPTNVRARLPTALGPLRTFAFAWRLLCRDARAGELTLIGAALVLAVASVTAVGFFTDRVQRALVDHASELFGADLVISAGEPIDESFAADARALGLAATRSMRFPSMLMRGERHALASVTAVEPGYPVRGEVRIAHSRLGPEARATGIPNPGEAWADERLFAKLDLAPGERITFGASALAATWILKREPDVTIGSITSGARLIVNAGDIPASGLVQPGSRVRYRLHLAGAPEALDAYRTRIEPRLRPGQRVEAAGEARPEIRAALARAERFLRLASLLSVVLAAVAVALAARRFRERHLDQSALMRCFGASQALLVRVHVAQFGLLGMAAALAGCAIGAGAQAVLGRWLATGVAALPAPGVTPALQGIATGFVLLLAFALPPLAALRRVPPLRVLRRELGAPDVTGLAAHAIGAAAIALMVVWHAQDLRLAGTVLGAFALAAALACAAGWVLLKAARAMLARSAAWGSSVASACAQPAASIVQVVALAAGIMALLALTFVRDDLVAAWRASLPPDTPNRFAINIQPDQVGAVREFLQRRNGLDPAIYPMVRARLTLLNDSSVSSADYADERARRLVEREFNVSWSAQLPPGNRLHAGRWWDTGQDRNQFSVESGLARTLGVAPGDTLTFDVAGTAVSGEVTSLRNVDWDTFHVNFFVLASPGALDAHAATYITAFRAPAHDAAGEFVRAFPNVVLIDVERVLAEVQGMLERASRAVQLVFVFALLAGLAVLYAALAATQDERRHRLVIMRTLGATRAQLRRMLLGEFALTGLIAGALGAAGAIALGHALAARLFDLSYTASPALWISGPLGGALLAAAAGYAASRGVLALPPAAALRERL